VRELNEESEVKRKERRRSEKRETSLFKKETRQKGV
jgi:hypothetical protein